MANTNPRVASLIEANNALLGGAGKTFLVAVPSSLNATWLPEVSQAKGLYDAVFNTIADAISACVSGRGDTILLTPGIHTLTAELAVNKGMVTIRGLGATPGVCQIVGSTSAGVHAITASQPGFALENVLVYAGNTTGNSINLTSNQARIEKVHVYNPSGTAVAKGVVIDATAGSGAGVACELRHCVFGTTDQVELKAGVVLAKIVGCTFLTGINTPATGVLFSSGTAPAKLNVLDCTFDVPQTGAGSAKVLIFGAATDGLIARCSFAVAANTQVLLSSGGALPAALEFVGNTTRAGVSVAKPA